MFQLKQKLNDDEKFKSFIQNDDNEEFVLKNHKSLKF